MTRPPIVGWKGAPWLIVIAACSGYEPRTEFWPLVETGQGGASNGGAAGAAGTGGRGGFAGSATVGGSAGSDDLGGAAGTSIVEDGSAEDPVADAADDGGTDGMLDAPKGDANTRRDGGGADGSILVDAGPGSCSLSVSVTTVTANGNYSPRNIGAIWIAKSTGGFVKTLAVWARTRIRYLTLWNSATSAAGMNGNTVDAVTGATISSHQTHKVTWNCTDATKTLVPDGAYRLYFELTDRSGTGPNGFVNFTKGPMPFTTMPPDLNNFKNISMVYTP